MPQLCRCCGNDCSASQGGGREKKGGKDCEILQGGGHVASAICC